MNTTQVLELVKLQMKVAVLNEMIRKANTQIELKGEPDSSQDLVYLGNFLYEGLKSINAISEMLNPKRYQPKAPISCHRWWQVNRKS